MMTAAAAQQRQARWEVERRRISKARGEFRRRCEDRGEGFLAELQAPLPTSPPDWFEVRDGERSEHETEWRTPEINEDGSRTIKLPAGLLGRPGPSPTLNEPTPNEAFGDSGGLSDKLKRLLGGQPE